MKDAYKGAAAGAVLCILAGCASSGIGTGELVRQRGAQPESVAFHWHTGSDHRSGEISAMLPDGQSFTGRFFEVTSTTLADTLSPLWVGWRPWWTDWPWAPYAYAGPSFMTSYSGRVLATLTGPQGKRMRCRFYLAKPEAGLTGGGQGKCQFADGSTVDAYFPPS